MKVALIGANGQLGSDFSTIQHNWDLVGLTHRDIEITGFDSVSERLGSLRPDVVINTAAFGNVPKCEDEPLNAFAVNGVGVRNLAAWCAGHNSVLVHISTDYVFDGLKKQPYIESDVPNPLNTYGLTKLAGEYYIKARMEKYFIVRSTGLYGKNPCRAKGGDNFVKIALRLAKENKEVRMRGSEVCTPTYTKHLAKQIVALIASNAFGLYHATNEGQCSWFEFAQAVYEYCRIKTPLIKDTTSEQAPKVKRPPYSVLENHRLKELGINNMPHWRDALREYLRNCP